LSLPRLGGGAPAALVGPGAPSPQRRKASLSARGSPWVSSGGEGCPDRGHQVGLAPSSGGPRKCPDIKQRAVSRMSASPAHATSSWGPQLRSRATSDPGSPGTADQQDCHPAPCPDSSSRSPAPSHQVEIIPVKYRLNTQS
jgi:hypothetical protein